jgi:hypothetical protein
MIFCACPSCKNALVVEDAAAGKFTTCLKCGSQVPVPIPPQFDLLPPVQPPAVKPKNFPRREQSPTQFRGTRRSPTQ